VPGQRIAADRSTGKEAYFELKETIKETEELNENEQKQLKDMTPNDPTIY
jgi:hypothetical protein